LGDLVHAFLEVDTITDEDAVLEAIAEHIHRHRNKYKRLSSEEKSQFKTEG
jgi:hypothetical protein